MSTNLPTELQDAILGTLLVRPSDIDEVAALLQPEDFFTQTHREAFKWMLNNREQGFDFPTISHGLKGKVDASVLAGWMSLEVIRVLLPRYCRELKDAARVIKLHDLATSIRGMCQQQKGYDEIREYLDSQLSQIGTQEKVATMKTAAELVMETIHRMQERHSQKGQLPGISYGWTDLDSRTSGMHRGDLIVIAGRPSMGKTAVALNIGTTAALAGHSVAIFSLEMGRDQVMDRITASIGRISYQNIRSGNLAEHEWPSMTKACEQIHPQRLMIDDSPGCSLADVRGKCRKIKADIGLDLIVIDYLQLMKTPVKDNRVHAIGEITRGLKLLARELDVAVILLSQLNRAVDGRQDKRPTMADLRDSGEIEQDSDVILFPYRPAGYCEKCRDRIMDESHDWRKHQAVSEIIIEKQRNGERNISIPMVWLGQFQTFTQKERTQ